MYAANACARKLKRRSRACEYCSMHARSDKLELIHKSNKSPQHC